MSERVNKLKLSYFVQECHQFFLMKVHTLMMMTKIAFVLWANSVLNGHDAVLAKMFSNIM